MVILIDQKKAYFNITQLLMVFIFHTNHNQGAYKIANVNEIANGDPTAFRVWEIHYPNFSDFFVTLSLFMII